MADGASTLPERRKSKQVALSLFARLQLIDPLGII